MFFCGWYLRSPARLLGVLRPGGAAERDDDCGHGKSSNSSKTDGFASVGAHFSESRLADPGDKYK